jgi:hypothetical protein
MKSDRIRCTTTGFLVVIVWLGSGLAAQEKPDFSGSWILESGSSGADIPQALSVSQSLVRTNVRGEPTNPFFKDITVTRALATGTRSDTYPIGVDPADLEHRLLQRGWNGSVRTTGLFFWHGLMTVHNG